MKASQIANGVEAMKLDDTPRAKSKNLDVLKEFEKAKAKNAANFVVIGMSLLFHKLNRSVACFPSLYSDAGIRPRRRRQKHTHGPPPL